MSEARWPRLEVDSGSKVDKPAKIVKRGTAMVRVTDNNGVMHVFKMRDTAFVPSYRGRMLSFRRMETAEHGLHFDGKGSRFLLIDGKHRIDLIDQRGLYYLRCETARRLHEQANAVSATGEMWHRRNAHSMDNIEAVQQRVVGIIVRGGKKHTPGINIGQECPVVKAHKQSKSKMPCQDGHATYPHKMVTPMKAKSNVLPLMKAYNALLGRFNTSGHVGMNIMKSDNDSVLKDKKVVEWLHENGIANEYSATYTAWQVRKVERMWRTLGESAHAMILTAGAEERLWPFAWRTAAYTLNILLY